MKFQATLMTLLVAVVTGAVFTPTVNGAGPKKILRRPAVRAPATRSPRRVEATTSSYLRGATSRRSPIVDPLLIDKAGQLYADIPTVREVLVGRDLRARLHAEGDETGSLFGVSSPRANQRLGYPSLAGFAQDPSPAPPASSSLAAPSQRLNFLGQPLLDAENLERLGFEQSQLSYIVMKKSGYFDKRAAEDAIQAAIQDALRIRNPVSGNDK